ncbi:hypothetical protein GCM10023322_56790 [Rugosimonospora acidiphila]|uniref:PKD domain-containing protein n=1 Tax=Rugosimonospora acidiphila TaxID=556531 RepID=A0ABP9SCD5_9ACTN
MRPSRHLGTLAPILLAAGALVIPAASASAAPPDTLYVNAGLRCDDSGDGSQQLPYCSIQAAANEVVAGQTVAIGGAVPYGSATITHSGNTGAPITFTSYGAVRPTVAGGLLLSSVHDVILSNLGVTTPSGKFGIQVFASSNVTVDRVAVGSVASPTANNIGVSIFGGSSGVTLSRSQITGLYGVGVQVVAGSQATVTTNRIVSYAPEAVWLDEAVNTAVTGNTIATACTSGIRVASSSGTLENNAVGTGEPNPTSGCEFDIGGLIVDSPSVSHVHTDYNSYHGFTYDDIWRGVDYQTSAAFSAATGQGAHDTELDELPPAQAPAEHSTLIDSGDANAPGQLTADILGIPRTDDPLVDDTGTGSPAPDRGAYELQDPMHLTDTMTPAQPKAIVPVDVSVTVTSPATSGWSQPISFSVDFGDGSASVPVTSGGTVTHTYSTSGQYTETTTATDPGGARETVTHQVTAGTTVAPLVTLTDSRVLYEQPPGKLNILPGVAQFNFANSDPWELRDTTLNFGDGTFTDPVTTNTNARYEYAHAGAYTARVSQTDVFGRSSSDLDTLVVGDGFLPGPNDPRRVYDSRTSGVDSVPAGGVVKLSLDQLTAGATGVEAALVNVTVTNPTAAGYIAVYPDGTTAPTTSSVDYAAGQTVANHTVALAGGNGIVDFYNHSSGPVDLIVDSLGAQVHGQASDTYQPDGPVRLLDTRTTVGGAQGPVPAAGSVTVQVAGTNGVPADAAAVVMSVAATDTRSAGFLTVYNDGGSRPGVSAIDWAAGQTASNLVVAPLTDGKLVFYNSGPGTANFLADIVGYYNQGGQSSVFLPSKPTRLLDTRSGLGNNGQIVKLQPHQQLVLSTAANFGAAASSGISSVEVNLTTTNATAAGYITAYPTGKARPVTASLDYPAGQTVANMAVTPASNGAITLYNGGPAAVDLIVDLAGGYYSYPQS